MVLRKLCCFIIILAFANVDYAQLITINASGKYMTSGKRLREVSTVPLQRQAGSPVCKQLTSQDTAGSVKEDFCLPLSYITVTSLFGRRFHPILHYNKLHAGIDLRANYEAVFAFAEGMVTQAGYDASSGNYITILHGCGEEKLTSIYAHLSYINVLVGERVQAGQMIGISGSTGASTAPHLHFALRVNSRFVDPLPVLKYLLMQSNSQSLNQ